MVEGSISLIGISLSSRRLHRQSSEGGLGTSDGLGMQNIDPITGHHVATSITGAPTSASLIGGYAGSTVGTTGSRRAYSSMSGRYPRSWHPSPFASDDDDASSEPQFYKEEKKNRIKMEIARRRQQIEENASLHDELTRLAKLRETAELSDRLNVNAYGTSPMSPAMAAAAAAATAAAGGSVVTSTGTSVLKSVDEILRSADPLHHPTVGGTTDLYGTTLGSTSLAGNHITGHHGLMNSTGLTTGLTTTSAAAYGSSAVDQHHRVTDFSPINSDMIDHRSHFRSSSADPTLSYGNASTAYTSMAGAGGVGVVGGVGVDPYGGKYSKYGTMTGTSSLYRSKY